MMTPWNFAKRRARSFPTLDDVIDCVKYWLRSPPPPDTKCNYCNGPLNGSKRKGPFDCWACSDRCQYASDCELDDMEDGEYHRQIRKAWEAGITCYKELEAWEKELFWDAVPSAAECAANPPKFPPFKDETKKLCQVCWHPLHDKSCSVREEDPSHGCSRACGCLSNQHPDPIQGPVKVEWEPLGQIEPQDLPEPSEQYPAPWASEYRGNGHFDIFDGKNRLFAHIYVWDPEVDGKIFRDKMNLSQKVLPKCWESIGEACEPAGGWKKWDGEFPFVCARCHHHIGGMGG